MKGARTHYSLAFMLGVFVTLALPAWAQDRQALPAVPACLLTAHETLPLSLELADTPEQRRIGLMGRSAMPADHGMLFRYDNRRRADDGFWMYQTLIPLDIAWLDQNSTIVAMDTMVPCPDTRPNRCPIHAPGVPHYQVLELNSGYFSDNSVAIGDTLILVSSNHNPCQ